jgi:glutaredoxin
MDNQVTVYTHPDCTYSEALKEELNDLSIPYEELDLAINPELWSTVEELTGGERITPVMVTGDSVEVGFHGVG